MSDDVIKIELLKEDLFKCISIKSKEYAVEYKVDELEMRSVLLEFMIENIQNDFEGDVDTMVREKIENDLLNKGR